MYLTYFFSVYQKILAMSSSCLHSLVAVGRYHDTGQDRSALAAVWEEEVLSFKSFKCLRFQEFCEWVSYKVRTAGCGWLTGLHLLYPGLMLFYVEAGEDASNQFIR